MTDSSSDAPAEPAEQASTSAPTDAAPQAETRARRCTVLADTEPVESLLEIKRSEFHGHLIRVETEEAAREHIERTRRRHHDARHVCSAFVLGPDRDVQRSSDDGEPAGTAGIPMLQALLSHRPDPSDPERADLTDVCAIVVRWFGGIKLGAGGLVRAYTEAVTQTLDEARLVTRSRRRLGSVPVEHARAGQLENELRAHGFALQDTEYAPDHAVLHLSVPDDPAAQDDAAARLAALSSGQARITWGAVTWIDG